jgi:serine/threonine-protein kinase
MGEVFLGEHELLGSRAAVKLLAPNLTNNRDALERFFREARAATRINHPGIVQVFDYGRDDTGRWFIVMEYLEGESLQDRLRRCGALPWTAAVELGKQMASALAAAHDEGVVHRDLKPANMFVTSDPDMPGGERIKLLDFGIAKLTEAETQLNSTITQTGAVIGTPAYMSPEQCRGLNTIDDRSDVYALGCVLFRCIAGEAPFVADTSGDYIIAHVTRQPPRLDEVVSRVPRELAELVERTLAKEGSDRPSAAEVRVRLENLISPLAPTEIQPAPEIGDTTVAEIVTRAPAAGLGHTPPSIGPTPPGLRSALHELDYTAPPLAHRPEPVHVTTLGSASGQTLPPPPRRNNMVIAAAAAATLIAVTAVSFVIARQGTDGEKPRQVAVAGSTPDAAALPPADAGAAAIAPAAPDAAPVPANVPPAVVDAGPRTRAVQITSRPSGATVRLAQQGDPAGQTPLTIELPTGKAAVWVSLRGHRSRRVAVAADDDDIDVKLQPRRRPSGSNSGSDDDPLGHR